MNCYKCQKDIPDNSLICSRCGAEMSQRARTAGQAAGGMGGFGVTSPYLPMNWYKALVKVLLYFAAAQNIINGIVYATGYAATLLEVLPEDAAITLPYFASGYNFVNIIYGVLLIVVGLFALFARFRLAKFRKGTPVILLVYIAVSSLIPLAYTTAFMIVYGGNGSYIASYVFSEVMTDAVMLYANYIYFIRKRKHLFAEGKNK